MVFRDDYEYIASTAIKKYSKPDINEVFCFIDPKRCFNRFVNAFAWHPTLTGVFVASYTYKTLNTYSRGNINKKINKLLHAIILFQNCLKTVHFCRFVFYNRCIFYIPFVFFKTKNYQVKKNC